MNRVDFIGLTAQSESHMSLTDIAEFFDHTITAYNIVKDVELSSMRSSTDIAHSSLKIQIETADACKLQGVVSYVNDIVHNHINTYGKSFVVNTKVFGENQIELYVQNEPMQNTNR